MEKLKIGITQGDINGIGPEILIKGLADNRILELCTPVIYSSPKIIAYYKKYLDIQNFNYQTIPDDKPFQNNTNNVVHCIDDSLRVEVGKSTTEAGMAAVACLNKAVEDLKQNRIDAVVTLPINKANVQSEAFNFPGHTEFFASSFESKDGLMIMLSEELSIAFVTSHIPLSRVPQEISIERINKAIKALHNAMLQDFNIPHARIAVLSLNPHCGDQGLLGNEENEIILPAIKAARNEGIIAYGPYASDGFFGSGNHKKFDAVLAMYHDQGMTAFKSISHGDGINYTAGLPIVRTSPAHGTAYDIAGQNIADPESFRHALYAACDIVKNRRSYNALISKTEDETES